VNSHIKTSQLLVGLPEIKQSPEEEAQRYRFNDDFKKPKICRNSRIRQQSENDETISAQAQLPEIP
jgi:hypothetical protein